jgi:hypothetical protein
MKRSMIVMVILAAFLAGCLPGQSPVDVQAQVNAAAASTVAGQAQLFTPTEEMASILTSTPFTFSSLTQLAFAFASLSGSSASTKPAYACNAINRRPFDNSVIHRGGDFDIKWTIINTGTKTWPAGVDVKYYSGPKMTSVKIVEIPKKMKPNDTYLIVLDANAPTQRGRQVMTWKVQGMGCYPYVAIIVK